jgi:hypothetical protein
LLWLLCRGSLGCRTEVQILGFGFGNLVFTCKAFNAGKGQIYFEPPAFLAAFGARSHSLERLLDPFAREMAFEGSANPFAPPPNLFLSSPSCLLT